MAQHVTAADLATFLDLTFTDGDTMRAELLIESISDEVDSYCNRDAFAQTSDDTVTLPGTYDRRLYLPNGPITSVSAATINGTAVTSSTFRLVGRHLVRIGASSDDGFAADVVGGLHWGGPRSNVTVTYTHGWAGAPGDVQRVVLRAAARAWANPEARRSVGLPGGYQARFADNDGGVFLTSGDLRMLAKYRVRPDDVN